MPDGRREGRPWRTIKLDACVAPLVLFLNLSGLVTIGSCCGHGKTPGAIAFEDGTEIELPGQ